MKWIADMTAFLADPTFGVDFENLCIDVCEVIDYLKLFNTKSSPDTELEQNYHIIKELLKRYQLVRLSNDFLSEYGGISKHQREEQNIVRPEEVGDDIINYYDNLQRLGIVDQNREIREHSIQWCTKVMDLLAYPEDGINLVNLYEKVNIVIGLLKDFRDEDDPELIKTEESIEENWQKHCELGSSRSHKMSM